MQLSEKHYQLVSTGINKSKPTDSSINWYENDHLFNELEDLVNQRFKAWYCRMFYELGKDTVLKLASQARADGKYPPKLFSKLLKEHAKDVSNQRKTLYHIKQHIGT